MNQGIERSFAGKRLTLLSKRIPGTRSVALGFWINRGARDESPATMGLSHFYEHMIFKGTRRRSMTEIARTLERRGGSLNAFTSKEQICLHTRCVDDDLPLAADLLQDMFLEPLFLESELTKEKSVVIEEIHAAKDDPEDLAHDLLVQCLWPSQPMGFPIAGNDQTVKRFGRAHLLAAMREAHGAQVVVAAAGNVGHAELRRLFSKLASAKSPARRPLNYRPSGARRRYIKRPVQQANVCLGFKTCPFRSTERPALAVLNAMLGDSMSSRLFQSVRERLGLAYSVFSFLDAYYDTGVFGIYLATDGRRMMEAVRAVLHELREVAAGRFTAEELAFAKTYMKGGLLLGLESPASQMFHMARSQMYLNGIYGMDTALREIDRVTAGDLRAAARKYFRNDNLCMAVVGPGGRWNDRELAKIDLAKP